jgi:Tfp pilus assembly protein PilV
MKSPSMHDTRGMTLVETITAISILLMAILGPISLSIRSIHAASDAKSEMTALYFASEGIEILHNYRDNNSGNDYTADRSRWLTNIAGRCNTANGCIIDPSNRTGVTADTHSPWGTDTFVACANSGCAGEDFLYFNPTTKFYRQSLAHPGSPWIKTGYRRRAQLIPSDLNLITNTHATIVVEVDYPVTRGVRTVRLTDELYNWFPPF